MKHLWLFLVALVTLLLVPMAPIHAADGKVTYLPAGEKKPVVIRHGNDTIIFYTESDELRRRLQNADNVTIRWPAAKDDKDAARRARSERRHRKNGTATPYYTGRIVKKIKD